MRPKWSESGTCLVVPAYILASVALTWPLAAHFSTAIPSFRVAYDPALQAFLIGWDWQALPRGIAAVFDAPIFHPEIRTLTYMDHMLGEALLGGPVLWATGSVAAAYNALVLLSFVASAWATYRLARLLGAPRVGAFLAGFLFAFSPFRYANLDFLNQLQTQFLPLALFFAIRYVQRGKLRDAVGVAATFALQVYFGWYYTFYLLTALLLLLAYATVTKTWRPQRAHLVPLAALGAGVLAVVAPVALPYIEQRLAMPEFRRTLGQSALYSADLLDYLKASHSSVVSRAIGWPRGPQSYWPGLVAAALGVLGAVQTIRRWRGRGQGPAILTSTRAGNPGGAMYILVLTISAFVFSLGPILHVAGQRIWIPLPYAALYYIIPGFSSMRAPARFAVLATLGVAVLAGLGYRRILASGWLTARHRKVAAVACVVFAVLLAWPRPLTLIELPTAATMPAAYQWLAAQPHKEPILEIPVPIGAVDGSEINSLRQYCGLLHGHPRLDGCSGFVSRRYIAFREAAQEFPDSAALAAMIGMGVARVLIHYGDYSPEASRHLEHRIADVPEIKFEVRFGDDAVYRMKQREGR